MRCIVTAGPTYEALDKVRRLTNFSTGRLGTELAEFLSARGHEVTLLIGQQATHRAERAVARIESFSTTSDLRGRLRGFGSEAIDAVFHAAAVSDFTFGKVWLRTANGELKEIKSGKISTREGTLLTELVPTPKILAELRDHFPKARLVGWKYEVERNRADVLALAQEQIRQCRTDASVANGPAYGVGFGLVSPSKECIHMADTRELFEALEALVQEPRMDSNKH